MLFSRSIWSLILLLGIATLTLANNHSEGDCDLSLTQPCRSNTSLCVPHEHVGDGILDCPDGSDEDCPERWFVCADLSACIRPDLFQDGVPDCHDDSDEECKPWQHECLCGYPQCIDGEKVGDGVLDCVEGSDELAIEKESYICPTDLHVEQEILRKKRRALKTRNGTDGNRGDITNYYSISPGAFAPTGVLTSTVYSFVNKETTSEYLTYVKGTSINGSYAQVTSLSSRTFFAIPTLLNQDQVSGLVSSFMKTTVSSGYTQTVVSRIYHTNIDGTYAQLVETETKGFDPPATNYVTILQGEELQGTFLSHPEQSLATLQFSHLEGSLNPSPVAAEIVTVTGTYGKFIRDGSVSATTYSVFTGSYVKDQKTYVFFFGNSALPHQRNLQNAEMDKVNMKAGQKKRKVILDMDQHMDVIMPSALKMNMVSKHDLLIGEGTVDGHKVDGLFIANREGFDVKGAQKKGGGDIKMLTVTIEQPTSVMMTTQTKAHEHDQMNPFFDISKQIETEADNEVDSSLKRGRKASINGNEIVVDVHNIHPTLPLPNGIPTFLIEEPSQNIGDIILRETIKKSRSLHGSVAVQDDNVVDNIKAKFNQFDIGEFPLGDSVLPTVTYYGFADFTTTIADTVVIFTPNSKIQPVLESSPVELPTLQGRVASTEITPDVTSTTEVSATQTDLEFSTVTTQVFNTLDLYPSGLVSSIGGTLVNDNMTTLFTTLVYGTYIQGKYAQVVRSTSSIFYLVSKTATPSITPTKVQDVMVTISPTLIDQEKDLQDVISTTSSTLLDEEKDLSSNDETIKKKENIFDDLFSEFQTDNAIGRSVDGKSSNKGINNIHEMKLEEKEELTTPIPPIVKNLTTTTYTFYTTLVQDGTPIVKTNFQTTQSEPVYEIITKPGNRKSDLTTLTHHTTKVIKGVTEVKSTLEFIATSSIPITPPGDLFFDILTTDSVTESNNFETTTEDNGSITEITTETPSLDTTESPGFSLESSLKPDDAVNAIYFPRTYYTTYTYFTTYHRLNTSSIVSSLETITNIITNDSVLEEHKTITPTIPTYPVTYWTTYTYWTTLVKDNSSITTSSKKTISNIVNLTEKDTTSAISDYINPVKPTVLPIEKTSTQDITTFYTTYTYYTTATIGNSVVVSSRLETESSVVTGGVPLKALSSDTSNEAFDLIFDITPTQTLQNSLKSTAKTTTSIETSTSTTTTTPEPPQTTTEVSPEPILETPTEEPLFSIEEDSTSTTESGLEGLFGFFGLGGTETTEPVTEAKSKVELFIPPVTETVNSNLKTGLLSTIRGSTIIDGMTTLLSTNIYGTYIDGLYVQIQSTTSEVMEKTPELETLKQTGVLTVNAGSIVENEVTTHYTTQHVGKYINQKYSEEILSTSRIEIAPEKSVIETNPTKTGRVREVIGSIIHGTKTTYYHSTILGTVIAGIYAQKVDSTSRFVSGPSIAFDILTDLPKIETTKITTTTPILEASLETTISPTPVVVATESLESENTIKNMPEEVEEDLNSTPKNRLAFPIRTSSKRRTDVFPFIRRTSTFRKQDAFSKVLAASTAIKFTETVTPKHEPQVESPVTSPKPPPSTRQFRFGFLEKTSSRRVKSTGKSGKKNLLVSEPPATARKIPDSTSQKPEEESTTASFRPFRFGEKSSLSGTRSHLPISRRNRPPQTEGKQTSHGSRFRFGSLPETTTKRPRPKTTTPAVTTEASSSKRPNLFSFLGRSRSEKSKETHKPLRKPSRNKLRRPTSTQQRSFKPQNTTKPHNIPKLPTAPKPPVTSKPFRQRVSRLSLLPRRRPIIPKLKKDESQVDSVYLLPDGTVPEGNFDDIEIITFTNRDAIHRHKRQAPNLRTSSRGIRRFVRNRDAKASKNQAEDVISPSPSEPEKARQPFTLSNPRSARPGLRSRLNNPKPRKPPSARSTLQSRTKSRNTLPFRPRRPRLPSLRKEAPATPKRGFRRPTNDKRFKISNRFRPKVESSNNEGNPTRRPSQFALNRNRPPARKPTNKSNPIQSFLARPKPKPKPKPVILPKEDGSFSIVEALTVTREVPVTTTIPLIENGKTVEKKVITASLVTETFKPDQITQTEIDGEIKLLLSTVENKQRVTQVFIQPIPSTSLVYTSLIQRGVEKTETQTIPITLYSVVTATAAKKESDVQDLLKLLILQQQQQNPFLAALGLNQPRVEHETRTFVTTITSLLSTEIPIIFRGKPIRTTVVDTQTEVITTTEITTKTLNGNPVASPSPFGPLLPLLLQNQLNRKARDIRPTAVIQADHTSMKDRIHSNRRVKRSNRAIDKEKKYDLSLEVKVLSQNEIEIWPALKIEEETNYNIPTPPLSSVPRPNTSSSRGHFLLNGPAEFTPLRRKVRSAQRGKRIRQRIRVRNNGARKIENDAEDQIQILDSPLNKNMANKKVGRTKPNINRGNKATTFYTTFTYYTTYLDDLDREIVKSSEETITQVATYGNIRFDDFTKISPTIKTTDHSTVPIQEMFTIEDAIIPGKPRPVPDPVFEEPDPPHGPIIRHDGVANLPGKSEGKTKRRKTIVRLRNRSRPRGRVTKPRTKIRLSSPVSTLKGDSLLAESGPQTITSKVLLNKEHDNKPRRIRVKLTKTKKRQVNQPSTQDATDEHISSPGGRKRIVITRRLPQQQSTVIASPVELFMGTVNVLHTVYSYHYSIYDQGTPISTSMRVITVSNVVEPTLVQVPLQYQTIAPTSNLYTIKDGKHTSTLGDRIENGYTTKIYLSSATLANVRPKSIQSSAVDFSQNVNQAEDLIPVTDFTKNLADSIELTKKLNSPVDFTKELGGSFDFGKDLSSSLDLTNELISSIDFTRELSSSIDFTRDLFGGIILQPSIKETTSNPTIRTPTFTRPAIKRTHKISTTAFEQLPSQEHKVATSELDISQEKSTASTVLRKPSISSKDRERQFYNRRRRPPSRTPEETTTMTEEEVTETTTFIPEEREDTNILNIFGDTYTDVEEKELKSTLPLVTSRSSRPSVRRDDIPIIRRPSGLKSALPHSTLNQLNSPSSTKLNEQPIDIFTTPATTNNLKDELQLTSPEIESAVDPTNSPRFSIFDSFIPETSPESNTHPESTTKFSLSKNIFNLYSAQPPNKSEETLNQDYYYYDDYTYEDGERDYADFVDVTTETPKKVNPPITDHPDQPASKSIFDIFGFLSNRKSGDPSSDKKKVQKDILDTTKVSPSFSNDVQVYSTYTTSTLLPILGGEQSTTLTLLTSKLISEQNRGFTAKHRAIPRSKIYSSSNSATLTYDDTPSFGTLSSDVSGPRSLADGGSFISDGETRPHRFSDFGLEGHHKLATKVMQNGVEVIVAEDVPLNGEGQPAKDTLRPSNKLSPHPITLPPSTLSNQVLLFTSPPEKWKKSSLGDSQMFHFKTYFTTLTYYNTLVQKGTPVVRTSKETISNVVSAPLSLKGNYVEKTKIDLTTSTYLATQTYTTNIGDLLNRQIVTSKEVITQIVVTEVPSISRKKVEATPTPNYSTVITKTYLTTYTFYKTFGEGLVMTETVVSSDVVTETSLQSSPLLPVISLTKSFNQASEDLPFKIYATKTYYTTSTYLTTILKGTRTITSSHIEVTSNVKTEPITSVINTGDILSHGGNVHPVDNKDYHFEEVNYLPIHGNVYKEFRTLFATYTHYTTLHNGRVKSNEVTKTELVTSLISTTDIPASLLMKTDDSTINPDPINLPPLTTATIFDDFFNVQLDPSYTESVTKSPPIQTLNSLYSSRSSLKESSSLKATVLVEEGSETGTSVVHDSTTKATLLVRPTTTNSSIEDAADIIIIETESLSSQPFVVETTPSTFYSAVDFNKPTSKLLHTGETAGLQGEDSTREHPNEEDFISSLLKREETTTSSTISVEPDTTISYSAPVRIAGSDPVRVENNDLSTGEGTSTEVSSPIEENPTKEGGSFGIGISPMLTAVAGLIGNTFVGKLAGQVGIRRSEMEQPILPKNAIVAADNGPLLIPVGGVGASLSSSHHSTTEPEQGFIPLHRLEFSETYDDRVTQGEDNIGFGSAFPDSTSTPLQSLVSMEKFGPSFQPPIETESGFTAMTQSITPTSVSVISGEETIFFGGLHSIYPSSPGDNLTEGEVNNFERGSDAYDASLKGRKVSKVTSHSIHSQNDSESISHNEKVSLPSSVNLEPRKNPNFVEGSHIDPTFLEATVGIGNAPRETSHQTPHLGEDRRTTVVRGASTVMSGVTTIFDTLYTKPTHMNDTTLPFKPKFEMFDTVQPSEISHTVTTTRFEPFDKSPATEVIQHIPELRTFVPTVIDTNDQSNTLQSIPSLKSFHESQLDYYAKTKLKTITVGPSTAFEAQYDDAELYRNAPYPNTIIRNEANLGYEEENEVNRFIESHSPDQEVGEPKKTLLCNRDCNSNEICKVFHQEQICICKPGYSRKMLSDTCSKSNSFQVDVVLEKFHDTLLSFTEQLKNKSHPNTKFLIDEIDTGIEEAMKKSDLGQKYRSSSIIEFDEHLDKDKSQLLARIKIDIDSDEAEGKYLSGSLFSFGGSPDETQVRYALEDSLHQSNYSLGGGDVVTRKESAVLAATDFNECHADEHNDCHSDATCINLSGTFGCECKEGFRDLFSDEAREPGRQCIESNTCSFCNYHGKCQENLNDKTTCICNDWFSGERCEINMKVMLIAVVSVGAFLLLLLLIFIVFCCCRTRKDNQGGFLRSSSQEPSTLDRRAMIHDTSSESSEDLTRIHTGTLLEGKLLPIPRTPRADYSIGKGSLISTISKDRSMTVRTSIPSVVIPRIKGYSTSNRSYTLEKENNISKFNYGTATSREASLVDILDGGPCPHMIQDGNARDTVLSVHSYGHRSRSRERLDRHHDHHHHHSWHRGSGEVDAVHHSIRSRSDSRPEHIHHQVAPVHRSGSADRLGSRSGYQDLVSEAEARSFSYADRAVSQARSYDETTVRPPIRTLKGESFRSRDVSSQILSDGMPTNAERDGNSTTVFPQMQLYKPLREGDSVSDFTGKQRFHRNEFFE